MTPTGSLLRCLILCVAAGGLSFWGPVPSTGDSPLSFENVAGQAGLQAKNFSGGDTTKIYILETTGCGAAFVDYDRDGWLDIFLVNGSRLEGFPQGHEPTNHLYRNNRNGTFTDVTQAAGLMDSGWGQGVCSGDYDNDGFLDLYVTYWGRNRLYHNRGDGTFEEVGTRAGVAGESGRWGTGCAFLDYDRDGDLDLFVANYVRFDFATIPKPGDNIFCQFKGIPVNCGPRGLPGETNILYRNRGEGTFEDASARSGADRPSGYYGLGVLTADFDRDGWIDIYVANDTNPSVLLHNNQDGTFTDIGVLAGCAYDEDGKTQSGMGVAAGDYDRDGWLDIFKTNFSDEAPNLYRNDGRGFFRDLTVQAGTAKEMKYVGWGGGFFDADNDGWLDLFYTTGHVYPELDRADVGLSYRQPDVLYRNTGGRFVKIFGQVGLDWEVPSSGRGCAFGDFDNDGDVDILINRMNQLPALLRNDRSSSNQWLQVQLQGSRSNRAGVGARVTCVAAGQQQVQEVRSGGSYLSQNDLRLHFGLGAAARVDRLEILWPSGVHQTLTDITVDRVLSVSELQH